MKTSFASQTSVVISALVVASGCACFGQVLPQTEPLTKTWASETALLMGRMLAFSGLGSQVGVGSGASSAQTTSVRARPPEGAAGWLDMDGIPPSLRDFAVKYDGATVFGPIYDPALPLDVLGKTTVYPNGQIIIRVGNSGLRDYSATLAHELGHLRQVWVPAKSPEMLNQLAKCSKDPLFVDYVLEPDADTFMKQWKRGVSTTELKWFPKSLPTWQRDWGDTYKLTTTITQYNINNAPRLDLNNSYKRFTAAGLSTAQKGKGQCLLSANEQEFLVSERIRLQGVVKGSPNDVDARLKLGTVMLNLGDARGAVEQFRAAETLNHIRADVYSSLAISLRVEGHQMDSLRAFETAHALSPSDEKITLALGFALCEASKHDSAAELFEAVSNSEDPSAKAAAHLGLAVVSQTKASTTATQEQYGLAEKELPGLSQLMTHLDMLRIWPKALMGPRDSTHPATAERIRRLKKQVSEQQK